MHAMNQITGTNQQVSSRVKLLKSLSHEGRLGILIALSEGEISVSSLEVHLNRPQASISQMLARLRDDGLVTSRREGKSVYYQIASPEVLALLDALGVSRKMSA